MESRAECLLALRPSDRRVPGPVRPMRRTLYRPRAELTVPRRSAPTHPALPPPARPVDRHDLAGLDQQHLTGHDLDVTGDQTVDATDRTATARSSAPPMTATAPTTNATPTNGNNALRQAATTARTTSASSVGSAPARANCHQGVSGSMRALT